MDGTGAVVQACDEASLRAAIAQGGTVSFGCSGTITLTQAITIHTNVAIVGFGALVTLSGENKTRLFNVSPGVELRIHSLELIRGIATNGGAIFNDGGSLVLESVTFTGHNATPMVPGSSLIFGRGAGGAIYSRTGTVHATFCTLQSNSAFSAGGFEVNMPARGGAICMDGGSLYLMNCILATNTATGGNGRGDGFPGIASPGTEAFGGAIWNSGTGSVRRCQFFNNRVLGGDGVAAMSIGSSTSGSSGGAASGGSIYNRGSLDVEGCMFGSNSAAGGTGGSGTFGSGAGGSGGSGGIARGAAIYNFGLLTISGSTFATNSGTGGTGGGAGLGSGQATPGGSGGRGGTVSGGALFNADASYSYLTNCTVAGNVARGGDGRDGGIGGSCIATGCTTGGPGGRGGDAGNAAGAGLYVDGGRPVVVHCTFDGNRVIAGTNGLGGPGGGGRTGSGASGADGTPGITAGGAIWGGLEVANSIFSRSVGSTNCGGRLHDLGVNISTDHSAGFTNPASMKNQDAGLGAFGDHGGPVPTIALLAMSVAIDRANNAFVPFSDARGVRRPQGKASDVGAFEVGHLTMTSVNTNAWLSYGAPPGTGWRLEGQANGGVWRELGTTTADVRGYAHYGPIRMTNSLEVFRTRKP
jgi:hypothetical protein